MARCPNCTETLHRAADGDYPAQCPKCGVRLKAKTKRPAAATVPHSPPTAEDRIVRSFSSRRTAAIDVSKPVDSPFEATAPEAPSVPSPESGEETLNAVAEPSPFPLTEADNPFAPPTAAKTETPKEASVVNPFGASEAAAPMTGAPRTGLIKGLVAGTLLAIVAGFGAWYGKDLLKQAPTKERAGFQNPNRNYVFYSLPAPWKLDEGRAKRAGFDLVLHRADLGGWVTLRSELLKGDAPDPKELEDEVSARWKDRLDHFVPSGRLSKMKLAGMDAIAVEGEGTLDGKPVRGKTLVLVAGGIKYLLGFEAPIDEWDKLERDFTLARESLEVTGGSVLPTKVLGENAVAAFESKKFPYRLSAPAGGWREVPDLQTESRFDDLKLQDKSRLGEVVVQARETKDLPGMRVRYVETQSKLYENKVREVEIALEKLAIHGRPAMRTMLIVSNAGGDFMFYTTFVQGDGVVFRIQCRAPVDKREVYEPIFAKITGSFEILDRPAAPQTSSESVEKEMPKQKPPAAVKSDPNAESKEPRAPAMNDGEKKPEEKAARAPEKKTAEPTKAEDKTSKSSKKSAESEKKSESTKKKKSLDDLD